MNFETTPPGPFSFGSELENYPTLAITRTSGTEEGESADGRALVGGAERYVSLGGTHGVVTYVAINSLVPGDTFLGVPLSLRPTKFRNELKKAGIATLGKPWDFRLAGTGVSFWVEEGEIVAIAWQHSSSSTR